MCKGLKGGKKLVRLEEQKEDQDGWNLVRLWRAMGYETQRSLQGIWVSLPSATGSCTNQFCTDDMRLERKMPRIRPVPWSACGTHRHLGTLERIQKWMTRELGLIFQSGDDPAESSLPGELFQVQSHRMCESAISLKSSEQTLLGSDP